MNKDIALLNETTWALPRFWLAVISMYLTACSPFEELSKHQEFIESKVLHNPEIRYHEQNSDTQAVAHARAGSAKDAIVIWLHGTPGAWTDIGRILVNSTATSRILWVSVDRAGWGGSSVSLPSEESVSSYHRKHYASFDKQLKYLMPLLDQLALENPSIPIIVAGHSWGGSLAPALALASDNVDGLVLFAGGLSPKLMKVRWYHKLANTKAGEVLLGDSMLRANEEMLALPNNLSKMNQSIENSNSLSEIPIYIIQGGQDALVNKRNANYWQLGENESLKMQGLQVFVDENFGHLWHIQRSESIFTCIKALVDQTPELCRQSVTAE